MLKLSWACMCVCSQGCAMQDHTLKKKRKTVRRCTPEASQKPGSGAVSSPCEALTKQS